MHEIIERKTLYDRRRAHSASDYAILIQLGKSGAAQLREAAQMNG